MQVQLKKIKPTTTAGWEQLKSHYETMKNRHMKDLFAGDNERFDKFSLRCEDIFLDYSKNIITGETLRLLVNLAHEVDIKDATQKMFHAAIMNETENRAVLHTALRNISGDPVYLNGQDIMPAVRAELQKMKAFSEKIIAGEWHGFTGQPITDIVNIGIGGSNLGPLTAVQALESYRQGKCNIHFVSNVDGSHISSTLQKLQAATTLFIVVSKSFTTQETTANAETAKKWFLETAKDAKHLDKHFIGVSADPAKMQSFGISPANMFTLWDFVGGRYSTWSAVSLALCCAIGFDHFHDFLRGAHEMDKHFMNAPFEKNIPVILGLLGIWYHNFFQAGTQAILPYDQNLRYFPAYLQQAHMESNGKRIDRNGEEVDYATSPVIWGETGTDGQHSFFQLLHQGTQLVPADFLAPVLPLHHFADHHYMLLANFFAQTEALMKGRDKQEVLEELHSQDMAGNATRRFAVYRAGRGNIPTNTILYKKMSPYILGQLMAMYEHKIFVQGVIWNIYSFDQWGVELGKKLAKKILPELQNEEPVSGHDASTNGLINIFKQMRKE